MTLSAIRDNTYPSSPVYHSPAHSPAHRASDTLDRVAEAGLLGFKYTRKAVSLLKAASNVADAYTVEKLPHGLSETLLALKVIKIVKGILALPELYKNVINLIKSDNATDRFYGSWSIVKSVKKIVNAVETVFLYLYKLNVISKAATAWTTVTGYIFMPVSIISAGIAGYECGAKAKFMTEFRAELKAKKLTGVNTPSAIATRTCKHILAQNTKLRKFEVITKDCPLNDRLTDILKRLKSSNLETRLKAAEEGKHIKKSLKHRVSEQVGIAAVGATVSTAGVACSIIGLACPPAAPALAITGIILTVIGLANFGYTKLVPQGDILDTEKRMLFASIRKGAKTTGKAIKTSYIKFRQEGQILMQKLAKSLSTKKPTAAAARAH